MTQTETINAIQHQVDQLGVQLQQQQVATCPLLPQAPPLPDATVPLQPSLHYYNQQMSPPTVSLLEVMDMLNRFMTNQYAILQDLAALYFKYKWADMDLLKLSQTCVSQYLYTSR